MLSSEDFIAIAERERREAGGRFIVPVYKRLSADLLTPVSAFLALRGKSRFPVLLESVEGGEKLGRYSFILKDPYRVVTARGGRVFVEEQDTKRELPPPQQDQNGTGESGNILQVLQSYIDAYRQVSLPDLPRLSGGAVGYLSYDTVRLLEHLPNIPEDDLNLPDAVWGFYDTLVAFDHVKHQMVLVRSAFIDEGTDLPDAYDDATRALAEIEQDLKEHVFENPETVALTQKEMSSNFTREAFEAAVERAKRYIYEGDIFQVVISQRLTTPYHGNPFDLYRSLRLVNPSPYMFFFNFGGFQVVGASPETLVSVRDRVLDGWRDLRSGLGDDGTAVVVTHGGPIHLLLGHLKGMDVPESVLEHTQSNCAVNEVRVASEPRIVRENATPWA